MSDNPTPTTEREISNLMTSYLDRHLGYRTPRIVLTRSVPEIQHFVEFQETQLENYDTQKPKLDEVLRSKPNNTFTRLRSSIIVNGTVVREP